MITGWACSLPKDHFPSLIGVTGILEVVFNEFWIRTTKCRNIDTHGCTNDKCEKHLLVILVAIVFRPLRCPRFYLVSSLWLLCLSAFPWFPRALFAIFWGFSVMKHLFNGTRNSALCVLNNTKPFSCLSCASLHNQWLNCFSNFLLSYGQNSFTVSSFMCDSHLNMYWFRSQLLPSSRKEKSFHRLNLPQNLSHLVLNNI